MLIVIEEVLDPTAAWSTGWRQASPPDAAHRVGAAVLDAARRLPVRYLTEDESVDVLAAALAPDFSGSSRPPDPPAHLRVLARRCAGVA